MGHVSAQQPFASLPCSFCSSEGFGAGVNQLQEPGFTEHTARIPAALGPSLWVLAKTRLRFCNSSSSCPPSGDLTYLARRPGGALWLCAAPWQSCDSAGTVPAPAAARFSCQKSRARRGFAARSSSRSGVKPTNGARLFQRGSSVQELQLLGQVRSLWES